MFKFPVRKKRPGFKSRKPVSTKLPTGSKQRAKKGNRFKRFSVALSLIFFIALAVALIKSPFLIIKNVSVEANNIVCASDQQIIQVSDIKGENFLLINNQLVEEKIK